MNASQAPYLSVVVTSRNDDHGGDPLRRFQTFINCFDAQCRRTGLDAEVIIVEWNPPPDRPRLQDLMRWPTPCACTYRFIDVPPELHGTLQYSDTLPLFQMIAKNVGIRRARGRFVLATNIDIIFTNELIEYLASGRLEPGHLYRVDRHDIQAAVPTDAPLDVQMAYCAEHHLRIHARWGSYAVDGLGRALPLSEDIADGKIVRLGSGWHVREGTSATGFYRWATDRAFVHIDRSADPVLSGPALLEIEFQANPYDPSLWVDLEIADESGTIRGRHRITRRRIWRLSLQGDHVPNTLELRVVAISPGSRRHLAAFESRGAMHYQVRSIRVTSVDEARTQPSLPYPAVHWQAMTDAVIDWEDRSGAVSVTTGARLYSYAVQYGPMRAPEEGAYRFGLTYDVGEGSISVGILDESSRGWLPAVVDDVLTPGGHVATVDVQLAAGATFSLMLSNDHGDGVSRVTIKELTGSVDAGRLVSVRRPDVATRLGDSDEPRPLQPVERRPTGLDAWMDRRRRRKLILAEESLAFSLDGWRPANFVDLPELLRLDEGLAVVSRGRRWSYCIEHGPFRAPITGMYRFALDYELLEGGIVAGLLSKDKRRWLRSSSSCQVTSDNRRTLVVSAMLNAGQTCWPTLSNDHHDGGTSRFVVKSLRGSVDPREPLSILVTAPRYLSRSRQSGFWLGQVTAVAAGYECPLDAWRIADHRDGARIEATTNGLLVETDSRRWSYAIEAGPLRATARGTYQFALTYDLADGGITLGVLDRDKTKWLQSSSADTGVSGQRTLTTSADLAKGQLFWLIVSNAHPHAVQPSRFVLRTMTTTVEPLTWRSVWARTIDRQRRRAAERIDASIERLRGGFAALTRRFNTTPHDVPSGRVRRLVNRVRASIVDASPEYAEMRASFEALKQEHRTTMAQVRQLSEFAHLHQLLHDHRPDALHLNGCGDFQLMAREHWFELRGYPEFQTFSMNIDALFSNIAYYAGIKERPLPAPHHIYHLEHEVGSGWTPEGEALLRRRIAERGITWLDPKDVFVWSAYMHSLRRPMIFNASDWGFGAVQLAESIIESRFNSV